MGSMLERGDKTEKEKGRDITLNRFEYIYKNKINPHLDEKNQFEFKDMNLLLSAYEYWRYEKNNKTNFMQNDDFSATFAGTLVEDPNALDDDNRGSEKSDIKGKFKGSYG